MSTSVARSVPYAFRPAAVLDIASAHTPPHLEGIRNTTRRQRCGAWQARARPAVARHEGRSPGRRRGLHQVHRGPGRGSASALAPWLAVRLDGRAHARGGPRAAAGPTVAPGRPPGPRLQRQAGGFRVRPRGPRPDGRRHHRRPRARRVRARRPQHGRGHRDPRGGRQAEGRVPARPGRAQPRARGRRRFGRADGGPVRQRGLPGPRHEPGGGGRGRPGRHPGRARRDDAADRAPSDLSRGRLDGDRDRSQHPLPPRGPRDPALVPPGRAERTRARTRTRDGGHRGGLEGHPERGTPDGAPEPGRRRPGDRRRHDGLAG